MKNTILNSIFNSCLDDIKNYINYFSVGNISIREMQTKIAKNIKLLNILNLANDRDISIEFIEKNGFWNSIISHGILSPLEMKLFSQEIYEELSMKVKKQSDNAEFSPSPIGEESFTRTKKYWKEKIKDLDTSKEEEEFEDSSKYDDEEK
jgi:hypothetical protein